MQAQIQTQELKGIFDFTYEEILFMVDALNGVNITVEIDNDWNTFAANIKAHEEFREPINGLDEKVGSLSFNESTALYFLIRCFWDSPNYNIPDTKARMVEVGLLA